MIKLFKTYPNLSRLVFGALLICAALIGGGIIPIPIPHFGEYVPNLGAVLVVIATWVMYRTENKNLSALGFDFKRRNLFFLPLGLLLGIIVFISGFYARTFITGERWNLNHSIHYAEIFRQLYLVLFAAAVQEFLIRGYCFKKFIEMTNETLAVVIFGLLFIAMHDFWNGNIVQVISLCLTLFIGHLLFAGALLRSGTIYFAIGLHWGNNFANSTLFTEGQQQTSLLFTTNQSPHELTLGQFALIFLAMNLGFCLLAFVIWKWRPGLNKPVH